MTSHLMALKPPRRANGLRFVLLKDARFLSTWDGDPSFYPETGDLATLRADKNMEGRLRVGDVGGKELVLLVDGSEIWKKHHLGCTLPETNIAPEKCIVWRETHVQPILFQVLY